MLRWMLPLIVILGATVTASAQETAPMPRPFAPSLVCEPPSDAEVLQALPRVPQVIRDDFTMLKNRTRDRADPPRFYPNVGIAQLHHCQWECKVCFTEFDPKDPGARKRACVHVLYVDKNYLQPVTNANCDQDKCDSAQRAVPASAKKPARPPYIIESPDNLMITAVVKGPNGTQPLPEQSITGAFLVRADGTVSLGIWGSVSVSGLSMDQAAEAVVQQIVKQQKRTEHPAHKGEQLKAENIFVLVDVLASNSKRFYVVDGGENGDQVFPFPWTGNETVLDALCNMNGRLGNLGKSKIWVARPDTQAGKPAQILPVDWRAITVQGMTATNYQIQSGDRLYIKAQDDAPAASGSTAIANDRDRLIPAAATTAAPLPVAPGQFASAWSARFAGVWYRETPGIVRSFTFTGDELKLVVVMNQDGRPFTISLTADYAVTKDGTVHGVFTGVDIQVADNKGEESAQDFAEASRLFQRMVDQPFAFRCRPSEGGLMVSNLRLPKTTAQEIAIQDSGVMAASACVASLADMDPGLCGKYVSATNGLVPQPKMKKAGPRGVPPSTYGPPPSTYSGPSPYEAPVLVVPQNRNLNGLPPLDAPFVIPPPPTVCPASGPGCLPATPPPEVQQMMMKALGPIAISPAPCPVGNACLPPTPAPSCLRPGLDYPDGPPAPTPPVMVTQLKPASSMPVGVWSREVGAVQYKLDVKENHLTVSVTLKTGEDNLPIHIEYVLTADCYPTRNPGEVVGIISSFDICTDTKWLDLDESTDLLKSLPDLQKEIGGKPMAFTFSVYDTALVLGNVRLPFNKDESDDFVVAFRALGGRYKSIASTGAAIGGLLGVGVGAAVGADVDADRKVPPMPTAAKPKKYEGFGGMTLPSGKYLEHQPQYFPADPVFPLPRELAPPPIPLSDSEPEKKPNPFRNGGLSPIR